MKNFDLNVKMLSLVGIQLSGSIFDGLIFKKGEERLTVPPDQLDDLAIVGIDVEAEVIGQALNHFGISSETFATAVKNFVAECQRFENFYDSEIENV